jgi:hypothetical protein
MTLDVLKGAQERGASQGSGQWRHSAGLEQIITNSAPGTGKGSTQVRASAEGTAPKEPFVPKHSQARQAQEPSPYRLSTVDFKPIGAQVKTP